jgi:hypothetical protein
MLCSYCNANRSDNEAPCQNCGAPSPLLGQAASGATWNNSAQPGWGNFSATNQWGQATNQWDQGANQWDQVPQLSFEDQATAFAPPGQDAMAYQQMQQAGVSEQRSLVPVSSYQGGMGLQPAVPQEQALPIIQSPSLEQMLPALPEDSTYVPPMYTKPRPIIPRYRIISGLISVIIVSLLACGGLGFYAKNSGMLHNLRVWAAGGTPQSLQAVKDKTLPDPKTVPIRGPAFSSIPVATTTSSINTKTNAPLNQDRIFKPGQPFYLTFTVPHPSKQGTVTVKWYTDDKLFLTTPAVVKPTRDDWKSAVKIAYNEAAEGKVEIYWNGKMAQTLFFVVRP